MAKISVIVPVYNTEYYLCRCLESLKEQTAKDIEFILVDDGSTDNSLKIMEHYQKQDSRFQILSFKENQGVSVARNQGIDVATGKYIGFVDSDDYVDANFYETLETLLDESRLSLAVGHLSSFSIEADTLDGVYDLLNHSVLIGGVSSCVRLFARDLIGEDRFLSHSRLEDSAFTILMQMKSEKIIGTNKTNYHYCNDNWNSFNVTSYWSPQTILDGIRVADYLGDVCRKRISLEPYLEEIQNLQKMFLLDGVEIIDRIPFLTEEEKWGLYGELGVLLEKRYGSWQENQQLDSLSKSVLKEAIQQGMHTPFIAMQEDECFQDFSSKMKTLQKQMNFCAK